MKSDEIFAEVQSFLQDKRSELDSLVTDADKFIRDTCKELDIPIWDDHDGGGKTQSPAYLILRAYLEYRLAGEIQARMVFSSFGVDITQSKKENKS